MVQPLGVLCFCQTTNEGKNERSNWRTRTLERS
jgi:hypothetical protein